MRTLLLIFTCKRPKYADTGGGAKTIKFCGRPLKTLTKLNKESYEAITTGFPTVEVELKKIVYQKEECRLGSAKAEEIDISDK